MAVQEASYSSGPTSGGGSAVKISWHVPQRSFSSSQTQPSIGALAMKRTRTPGFFCRYTLPLPHTGQRAPCFSVACVTFIRLALVYAAAPFRPWPLRFLGGGLDGAAAAPWPASAAAAPSGTLPSATALARRSSTFSVFSDVSPKSCCRRRRSEVFLSSSSSQTYRYVSTICRMSAASSLLSVLASTLLKRSSARSGVIVMRFGSHITRSAPREIASSTDTPGSA